VLSPICPHSLDPHPQICPFSFKAIPPAFAPDAIDLNIWLPTTLTGDDLFIVVLSPRRPWYPSPQAHKVPFSFKAKQRPLPVLISVNKCPPTTETGEE